MRNIKNCDTANKCKDEPEREVRVDSKDKNWSETEWSGDQKPPGLVTVSLKVSKERDDIEGPEDNKDESLKKESHGFFLGVGVTRSFRILPVGQ